MSSALVIGGTGFLGRHTVENLVDDGYSVTSLSRSHPEFPFSDPDAVTHLIADRTDEEEMEEPAD